MDGDDLGGDHGDAVADQEVLRIIQRVAVRRPPPPEARRVRVRVRTTSGAAYDLNPATMTATRSRLGEGVTLRRDGERLDLWTWPTIVVGRPLQMLLSVREDTGDPTIRLSTPVAVIEDR